MTDLLTVNDRQAFTITEFSPLLVCLGDASKFRVVARVSPPPKELLKKAPPLFEKAVYSTKMDALLIKNGSSLVTIYASGIVSMTRLNSGDHGRQTLQDIVSSVSRAALSGGNAMAGKAAGAGTPPDPMAICRMLPRSNCGKCGFKSCLYFATMMAFSEVSPEKCTPLLEERYTGSRHAVAALISGSDSG